jgi:hypothetical protein
MEGTSAVLKAVKSRTQNTFQDKKFIAVTNRRWASRLSSQINSCSFLYGCSLPPSPSLPRPLPHILGRDSPADTSCNTSCNQSIPRARHHSAAFLAGSTVASLSPPPEARRDWKRNTPQMQKSPLL